VKSEDWDKLLEQGLAGDPPRPGFREEVLADSVAAFVRGRRSRAWRRAGSLAAAAVLIGAVSFLLGRHSLPEPAPERAPVAAAIVTQAQGVTVPNDLVAWLDAARLFHQLGMPERMGRAVDRASRLLPADATTTAVACSTAAPGCEIGKITPEGGGATWTSDVTSRTTDPRFTILSALALPTTPLPLRPSPREPCPSSAENASQVMAPSLGD
jgi:hypothetical protein